MKIILVISVLTVGIIAAKPSGYSKFVEDQEILQVINDKIRTDQKNPDLASVKRVNIDAIDWDTDFGWILGIDSGEFRIKNGLDSILSQEDKAFMLHQLKDYASHKQKWNKGDLNHVRTIIPKRLNHMKKRDAYWEYSMPLFSKDLKYCILTYNYVCGSLCASFRTSLFLNQNGKWVEHKTLLSGES